LLLFGNGGAAAAAQHIATELVVRYNRDSGHRRPMAAIALTTDTSAITAIGNDFGFDDLFARQVEALCLAGDVAIGISTLREQRERDSRIDRGACGRRRDGGICRRWWRPDRRAGGPPRLRPVDEHRSSSGDAHGPWPRAVCAAREGRPPVTDRFVTSRPSDDEAQYEAGLRPRSLDEYIGQDRLRDNLQVAIAAARGRREALDHVLLYGPPGLGKTTLAYVIGNEMGVPVRATAGPVIERPGDLAGMLTDLQEHAVLFIDEIHRMAPAIEEILYPAMEDYELDIVIGQGPSARSVKVPLQKFTLIGATTRAGLLTSPLRARFGIVHRLDFYTETDVEEIVRRSARILGVTVLPDAAIEIARPLARNPAYRQPTVAPCPRLRASAGGWSRDRRGCTRCTGAARSGRPRFRRSRSQAAADDHRQIQRWSGRRQQHRRRHQRRERRD
jgi:hypothetical protein